MFAPLETVAHQRVGRVLQAKWRLDALLGVGGMAAVYAATHRNGKRVAVKVLHPQVGVDPTVRERFLREGYIANSIGHEGAVSVLDDDVTSDGEPFLVMELLEGETLEARAQRCGGRLPVHEVVSFASQLLEVLAAAHSKGIVHRGLKPENLFVTTKGQLKVLDFGIARLLDLAGGTGATRTGSMLGTPAFMPPEQALGHVKEVDHQSDLWAVGATMFTLLSGTTVHPGNTVNEQIVAAATRPVGPVASVVPGIPQAVAGTIDRALSFHKAQRFTDAASMLASLGGAQAVPSPATVVCGPRASQLVSHPDHPVASPVGTGTVTGVGQTLADPPAVRSAGVSKAALAIAAGAVTLLAVVAAVVLLRGADDETSVATTALPSAAETREATPPAETRTNAEPPVVPSAAPTVRAAVVDIVSEGGVCQVKVDGAPQGATPVRGLEVTPGEHEVRCASPRGTQTKKVLAEAGEHHTVTFAARKAGPVAVPTGPVAPVNPLDIR
jgi:hypothetical protein